MESKVYIKSDSLASQCWNNTSICLVADTMITLLSGKGFDKFFILCNVQMIEMKTRKYH